MRSILFLNGNRVLESTNKLTEIQHLAAMKIYSTYGGYNAGVYLVWEIVAYDNDSNPILYKTKGFDCVISVVER